ncbi:MAG: hypothetical protein JKX85_15500 [Phycisphaeraceae bacterium]|nr:hypothetical protein [Phycisphaeraceae bacterium]
MIAPIWQRIGIALGVLLGSLCWVGILPSLKSATGTQGIVLLDAPMGMVTCLLVMAAAVPILVLSTLLCAVGRFTTGISVFAGSLLVLAYTGGSTIGWLERADLPGSYWQLITEMLLWQLMLLCAIALIYQFRPVVHRQLPVLVRRNSQWKTVLKTPGVNELMAAVISSVIALIMSYLLIQNASINQILCGLVFSFALGAGMGQTLMPNTNPVAIFMSPFVVAICAYFMVLFRYEDQAVVMQALFNGSEPGGTIMAQFPGPALALPIHYASAGLLGCCIGIGIVRAAADDADQMNAGSDV